MHNNGWTVSALTRQTLSLRVRFTKLDLLCCCVKDCSPHNILEMICYALTETEQANEARYAERVFSLTHNGNCHISLFYRWNDTISTREDG